MTGYHSRRQTPNDFAQGMQTLSSFCDKTPVAVAENIDPSNTMAAYPAVWWARSLGVTVARARRLRSGGVRPSRVERHLIALCLADPERAVEVGKGAPLMRFGDIEAMRYDLRLPIHSLVKRLGVDVRQYYRWHRGDSRPRRSRYVAMAWLRVEANRNAERQN